MSSKIKGITIEIGANTSKLQDSIQKINNQITGTQKELKAVNSLLKFDPKNTELLSQKQQLLTKAISDTNEKLKHLKELKAKADADPNIDKNSKSYRELEREIASTTNSLKSLQTQQKNNDSAIKENTSAVKHFKDGLDDAKEKVKVFGDVLKANLVSKAIVAGIKGISNAVKGLCSEMSSWSEMSNELKEQEAKVTQVMKNTTDATDEEIKALIDLTAKKEKLGVVSQETQLAGLQELGTYVENKESLEKLLPVMNDMIAQQYGVGASMESATSIATMMGKVLGNGQVGALSRLGYKFDEAQEKVLKFGTEEEKAAMLAEVIQQSVGGMNEALALTNAGKVAIATSYIDDMKKSVGSLLSDTKQKLIAEFLPSITEVSTAITGMIDGSVSVEDGMNQIVSSIEMGVSKISELLPTILSKGTEIVQAILNGIVQMLPSIMPVIVEIINTIVGFLVDNLPTIFQAGVEILFQLIEGLVSAIPDLIPAIVEVVLSIVDYLIQNIDKIIELGVKIIMALIEGIIKAVPTLVANIPKIISAIVSAIFGNLGSIVSSGAKIIGSLISGITGSIGNLVSNVAKIPGKIANSIKNGASKIVSIGKDLMSGLWGGIKDKWNGLKDKVKSFGQGIVSKFKNVFGIHSPSKVMKEQIGENLGLGIVEGIEDTVSDVDSAMKNLSHKVETSVNPTINPTTNSNPLIIQIENFNNERSTDIQALAQELEFYRRKSAQARGGN